jgi:S1-C subfamily serine protease
VELGLLRDGKPRKVTAMISELAESDSSDGGGINRALEGADLADANEDGGVIVRSIQDGSPAAQVGLRTNDVIVAIGRTRVANLKQFKEAVKGAKVVVLNVRRGSAVLLIPIR